MYEADVAMHLLAMLKARDEILGPDIAALGEHAWVLILQMFVQQAGNTDLSQKQLSPSNLNHPITKRVIDVLFDRDIIEQKITSLGKKETSYQLTQPVISKIQMVLAGALTPVK